MKPHVCAPHLLPGECIHKSHKSSDAAAPRAMPERPILFSGEMVRAILDGRKTQTRRPIAPTQPRADGLWPAGRDPLSDCPFGAIGDRLWVRETWGRYFTDGVGMHTVYRADGEHEREWLDLGRWRPSIHMPRWASRLTLRITHVRVERLQDISEEDARAEGVEPGDRLVRCLQTVPCASGGPSCCGSTVMADDYRAGFQRVWRSIYGAETWDANPWVWAISFEREVAS